jgi:hypothetical protein
VVLEDMPRIIARQDEKLEKVDSELNDDKDEGWAVFRLGDGGEYQEIMLRRGGLGTRPLHPYCIFAQVLHNMCKFMSGVCAKAYTTPHLLHRQRKCTVIFATILSSLLPT